ncbi:DUF3488 and transglutaminase-like domain-containing protein [Thalassotalea castellviae]|uniref:DUF3488 and transglutaminase-like domain-containing protein n=1 Tax=Thalassotalea castellviae TaxID=3075612 RepID=A0ABU3A8K0_9GAMM|nr:DUF3488 and transglutaminase-like domain-containing protein [Thalassotalea sp. W431]MDT0605296.1 DUF3488 and transglutaminase-like domain-containing protein [Thalassotalea sp. W431]
MFSFRSNKKAKASNHAEITLSNALKLQLIFIQLLNLSALMTELALWFISLSLLCLLWQLAISLQYMAKPANWVKILVSIVGCLLLVISAKHLGLLLGMVHLLCLAYLLKPFELRYRKDFYQLVVQGLFILATAFIFTQSIYFTVVIFCLLILNLAWLLNYFSKDNHLTTHIKQTAKLLLQSLPLAIVLFIFMPKLSPLWHVPLANSAKTGLSDEVTIGDISRLALSNELAFRVEFTETTPSYRQMYWRAIVLDQFDGTTWRRSKKSKQDLIEPEQSVQNIDISTPQLSYQVIAEPSFQRWLYALDVAKLEDVKQNKVVFQLKDRTILSREKIAQPLSYSVTSLIGNPPALLSTEEIHNKYLAINPDTNPLLVGFGKQLKSKYADNKQLIEQVLTTFRQENYRYTLNPPILTNNSLDEFYFDTKAGFCEHYASSFTFLMRAAGIPSRMVLGYLGGQYNSQGNYFSVLQRDAHAWSEVWLENEGWVRVDPTASVEPSRVEQGFSQQLLLEKQSLSNNFDVYNYFSGFWLSQLLLQFEALDYLWTKLVINFTQEKQSQLFTRWFGENFDLATVLVITATLFMVAITFWLRQWWGRVNTRAPRWIYYYQQIHKKLTHIGLKKGHEQIENNFVKQIADFDVHLAKDYQQLMSSFQSIAYQRNSPEKQARLITQMKTQFQRFNKRIHSSMIKNKRK